MKKLKTILGVSAGNGVMLYPFKDILKILGNIEGRNDYTVRGQPLQWDLNFKAPFINNPNRFMLSNYPDVIIGHPKCGNSSKLALSRGKEYRTDKHRTDRSFNWFINYVFEYEPKVWMFENLPKLMEEFSEEEFKKITDTPWVKVIPVNDVELGGSQETRNRIIVIGSRIGPLVTPIIKVNQTETADKLIENIPKGITGHFRESLGQRIAIYGGQQLSIRGIKNFWFTYYPDRKFLVIDPEQRKRMNHAPGVYINWAGMLPKTVRKSNRQFNHDGLPMTPRELARLQNIPDDFELLDYDIHDISFTTALNKSRITVGSTPSYNVGLWFREILKLNELI